MTTESGGTLLARLGSRSSLTDLDPTLFADGPKQGCVYEFSGEEGSAKSQTLLHLMAKCLLPKQWRDYSIGGQGAGVILVDNDYHFSILRLTEIMENQVIKGVEKQLKTEEKATFHNEAFSLDLEELLKNCLRHLHVIQCQSLRTMLVTMETITNLCAHNMNKCLLIVDSISTVFGNSDNPETKKYFPVLIGKLQSMVSTYKLVLFVSRSVSYMRDSAADENTTASGNMRKYYEYMGKVWINFVTHKFIFSVKNRAKPQLFNVKKDHGFDQQSVICFQIKEEGLLYNVN